ncbi:cyclic pyranopterin monophosphate synthase MoaC, partial [Desulfomarina sp.]
MVDVGSKQETERVAYAAGNIRMSKKAYELVRSGSVKKGD